MLVKAKLPQLAQIRSTTHTPDLNYTTACVMHLTVACHS